MLVLYPSRCHRTPRPDWTSTTQSAPRRSRTTAPNIWGERRSRAARTRHLHALRNPAKRLFLFRREGDGMQYINQWAIWVDLEKQFQRNNFPLHLFGFWTRRFCFVFCIVYQITSRSSGTIGRGRLARLRRGPNRLRRTEFSTSTWPNCPVWRTRYPLRSRTTAIRLRTIFRLLIYRYWSNDFLSFIGSQRFLISRGWRNQNKWATHGKIPDEWVSRLASSPRSSDIVHEATKTKSVTKDGMVHLSIAALPRMTCSLLTSTT